MKRARALACVALAAVLIVRTDIASAQQAPPSASAPPSLDVPLVRITMPPAGLTVAPGTTIRIRVEPLPGASIGSVLVVAPAELDQMEFSTVPFTAEVTVPPDFAGDFQITAWAKQSDGALAMPVERVVVVKPIARLSAIEVRPDPIHLGRAGDYQVLEVSGHFADGVRRAISEAAAGTTYRTDAEKVATVSADGRVFAAGEGSTLLHVRNAGRETTIPIEVDLRYTLECGNGRLDPGEDCDPRVPSTVCCSESCRVGSCPPGR